MSAKNVQRRSRGLSRGKFHGALVSGLIGWLCMGCPGAPHRTAGDVPADGTDDVLIATELPRLTPAPALDLDPAIDRVRVRLVAEPYGIDQWAYNGQIPGPTIRTRVGDEVTIEVVNRLPNPTTIHWHGVGVPFAMDGVPWLTAPIAPLETFTYVFKVETPGTFWYHPHFDTYHQVDRGLYGAFIVEGDDVTPGAEPPDQDLVFIADQPNEALIHDEGPEHRHGLTDPAAPWLVNGVDRPEIRLGAGERARVRFINASNSGYLHLSWPNMRQIAADQGLLPELQRPTAVVVGPGDRAEFEWHGSDAPFTVEALPYTLSGGAAYGGGRTLIDVVGDSAPATVALTSYRFQPASPTVDPGWTTVHYVLTGSAEAKGWMINGETFPDVTITEVDVGTEVIVEVRNLSATEHPFHMHGHAFEVLSIDGVPPLTRRIEDTINVPIRQTVRLRFEATEPGDWMTHCHILPHADGGMMTVFRVNDTP